MFPLISLVSGTYNRIKHLQAMVTSFRRNIPTGISYEIIIVDGGSTDATITWCKAQPDITLIEQGELLGAIKAFDTGAEAATGEYVILANDDVLFMPNSILPALVHLETNPLCGAVAFADDRPAPSYGDGFKVQTMTLIHDGRQVSWPYTQVGMFRRWLGDQCGWWGSRDSVMGWKGSTYGGDNFLSARVYEMGYTIGVVEGCKIHDSVPPDNLREHNYQVEQTNPGAYYMRFPTPPVFASTPQVENAQEEHLRILYLPLYERGFGHYKRGLLQSLAKVGLVYELDYISERGQNLADLVRLFQPHIMLSQVHNSHDLPLSVLAEARAAKSDMLAINWNGDVWEQGLTSDKMLVYLNHFDLVLGVNETAVDTLNSKGIPAAYWQIGHEPVDESQLPTVRAHDVVFLANAYSPERLALGRALKKVQGLDVGLYGRGWENADGQTTYAFDVGRALYKAAKIAISDNQYPDQRGFVSNRLFEALASGVLVLQQRVEGLEELTGLKAGVHYAEWVAPRDLIKTLHYWLDNPEREKIAKAGQKYARQHHSFDARVQELFALLPMIQGERV